MPAKTAIATVLSDGHLSLPKEVRETLGLRKGCRLEVRVRRVLPPPEELETEILSAVRSHETSLQRLESLVRQLISRAEPSGRFVRELEATARAIMPKSQQRRLRRLLDKQAHGLITSEEKRKLDALVEEGQIWNVYKANAALMLRRLGMDRFVKTGTRQAD